MQSREVSARFEEWKRIWWNKVNWWQFIYLSMCSEQQVCPTLDKHQQKLLNNKLDKWEFYEKQSVFL